MECAAWEEYAGIVRAIARGLARQYGVDSRDLEQEGYAALLAVLPKLRAETAGVYVRMRVRGAMLDALAREGRHRHEELAEEAGRSATPDPEAETAAGERRERLARAVADLPDRQRAVVEMRLGREMAQSEIGRALGIAQPAVSQLESRARRRLRAALAS